MPQTPSPLRYPGGKTSLLPFLKALLEKNAPAGVTYVEPFCGGAGAAIGLLLNGVVGKIVLNDVDSAIHSVWWAILNETEAFVRKLESTPIDIEEWRRQKAVFLNKDSSRFEEGFAALYLNRCNRSGILLANPIGGLTQEGKWKMDARFRKNVLIGKIERIAERKADITLYNEDVFGFLRILDGMDNIFVYFDPPYIHGGPKLYLNSFTERKHQDLADLLANATYPWIMTYDDNDSIKKIYSYCSISQLQINYSAHVKRKGAELLIAPRQTAVPDFGLYGQVLASPLSTP